MFPEKISLSVAIITKNEEKNLPECLKSVSFADDVVVVDSGSTDGTVEIAQEFGCRVFIEDWKGDGPQKNSAIEKCIYDWVLIIDADERVPAETKKRIMQIIRDNGEKGDAISFPRKNFFRGRWIKHCGWWPDTVIRLVKKNQGRFESITHGKWRTSGTVVAVNSPIEHFIFHNYADMLNVLEVRSTDMARELYDEGRRANALTPLIHGFAMFTKVYFLRLGFLDGFDGFVIATTRAGGTFFKYAKLLELQSKNQDSRL